MKKFFRLGLPVIVLALGMVFVGCENASTVFFAATGSVTFNWNAPGTDGQTVTRDFTLNGPVDAPDQPTLNGFQFYGWYEQSLYNDGLAKYDFTQKETRKDFTLYAWWLDEDGNVAYWLTGDEPIPPDYEGFVWVKGGKFTMGSPETEEGRGWAESGPQREVTLTKGFYLGKYPVTQKEYEAVMGDNPSHHGWYNDDMPVGYITWFMAVEYCNKRSEMEGLTPSYTITGTTDADVSWNRDADGYRLPSEAEWEYAARGGAEGSKTYYIYAGSNDVDEVARYAGNSPGNDMSVVGTRKPNELGLYDMSGNIAEWVWDWADYYPEDGGPQTDPIGPDPFGGNDDPHILRGGNCSSSASGVRSAFRMGAQWFWSYDKRMGFRIVRPGPLNDRARD